MSDQDLSELPALVTRKVFRQITGLSDRDLTEMRRTGEIRLWLRKGGKYGKYYRSDAERIAAAGRRP